MSEINNNDFFKQVKAERIFKLAKKFNPSNPGVLIGIWDENKSKLLEEYILSDPNLVKEYIENN